MDADRAPQRARTRSFLGWALFISLAVHVALAPLVARYQPPPEPAPPQRPFHIGTISAMPPPTPLPTPHPTPKPSSPARAPAKSERASAAIAPHAAHLHVPRTASASTQHGPVESAYSGGSGDGPRASNETGDVGAGASATLTPTPVPPTPTPKPACAQPHVEASILRAVEPDYPEVPRMQRVTGTAKIRVTLSDAGTVVAADVYDTSGNALLDDAALAAAKASTYAPEVEDCRKIPGSYIFRAEFSAQ